MDEPAWLDKIRGYIDIGMLDEAFRELESLPSPRKESVDAKEMLINLLLSSGDLDKAFSACEELSDGAPENHAAFIQGAYCLHSTGETQRAIDFLQSGPKTLLDEPVYFYNLACYEVALDRYQAALTWLNRAIEMKPAYRQLALNDEDLAAIREAIIEDTQR